MSTRLLTRLTVVTTVTFVAVTLLAACAATADSPQTIYLNPKNGQVISASGDHSHDSSDMPAERRDAQSRTGTGLARKQTSSGQKIVRCPDGSLHMGASGGTSPDDGQPGQFCAQGTK